MHRQSLNAYGAPLCETIVDARACARQDLAPENHRPRRRDNLDFCLKASDKIR